MRETEQAVRQELQGYFSKKKSWSANIDSTLEDAFGKLEEFMLRGGKFVRPFLMELGFRLSAGHKHPGLAKAGAAVEIFKNYVLNIDDMADRDVLRHGGPTLEATYRTMFSHADTETKNHYGRSFSEVVGGVLATSATELLLTCGVGTAENRADALITLEEHLLQITAAGWQIHFHQNLQLLSQASEEEFLKGLELVNSHYTFIGPLLVGSALSGNTELNSVFREYGKAAGLAFQLHDDVLGLFGDPKVTGKAVGNDVREGKKTVLLQAALRAASPNQQEFLERACGNSRLNADELKEVQNIVRTTGALEYSTQLAEKYSHQAASALKHYGESHAGFLDKPEVGYLLELAQYIVSRDH